jgi:hypothetical protein
MDQMNQNRVPETWIELCERLNKMFGIKVDLNGVLYLVGIRERGLTFQDYSKEEKYNLINLGSCTLYKEMGLVEITGYDPEGWPVFRQKSILPSLSEERKEKILEDCALIYFRKVFENS